jgi:hypothetical protein
MWFYGDHVNLIEPIRVLGEQISFKPFNVYLRYEGVPFLTVANALAMVITGSPLPSRLVRVDQPCP